MTTLFAGLCCRGIAASCVFDGAINGERFRAYVEQMLPPTWRPDDIVVLDNLSSHKAAGVAEAIIAQGAQLVYLPPHSPDLNLTSLQHSEPPWNWWTPLLSSGGSGKVSNEPGTASFYG